MAKGNGGTRAGSAGNPSGVNAGGNVTTSVKATPHEIADTLKFRLSETDDELKDIKGVIGVSVLDVINYQKEGKEIPKDALQLVFGRGALDGMTTERVLQYPEFQNIKVEKVKNSWESGGFKTTYISGYKNLEQVKRLVDTAMHERAEQRVRTTLRRWGF